jgi:acetoacetyl-CoA synthetase
MNAPPLPEPRITAYLRFLRETRGLQFPDYDALWRWSTSDLDAFWRSVWDYHDLQSPTPPTAVLAERRMPGAVWFPGAQVNFAQQVLRHADAAHAAGCDAILFQDEALLAAGQVQRLAWPALRERVGALAAQMRRAGVQPGDRVVGYLPNRPETIVCFLACASLGAVWSLCSPDMGPVAVLDRWRQIEPTLLIACDRYTWGGVEHDRSEVVDQLRRELPTLRSVWRAGELDALIDAAGGERVAPQWLPFDHPLWIVYSSGTTGLPKAIVHGHGGVMLEALKGSLHNNLGPSAETGDRFHWFSSSGWIMWNAQVGALLGGTTVCIYDGNPGGPAPSAGTPDWGTLWRFAAATGATFVGAGAAFYASCLKADVHPQQVADLSALRAVGSTGSPLSEEGYRWIRERLPKVDGRDIWIDVIAGGTDFAGAFFAGLVTLPVIDGEMQCRCLGAAVASWSEAGEPLIDQVGELVCTEPLPSMPLYFWNDPGGQRLHDSYFDMFPGVWRHGDWLRITPRPGAHGAIIYGRSDATINRHGIRMGTAELYRAVEALPEVIDSLVVDLEYLGRESYMPLFVVLRDGLTLDEALVKRIRQAIRDALSARHVPNEVHQVSAIPRTLSGKKMELPVKKLLLGAEPEAVLKRDAMANADCVAWFVEFAKTRAAKATPA